MQQQSQGEKPLNYRPGSVILSGREQGAGYAGGPIARDQDGGVEDQSRRERLGTLKKEEDDFDVGKQVYELDVGL